VRSILQGSSGVTFAAAVVCMAGLSLGSGRFLAGGAHTKLREQAASTMREAACFFRTKAASHGGYVYYYSAGLRQRWGEGAATADQIYIASEVFSRNVETLCEYLTATAGN